MEKSDLALTSEFSHAVEDCLKAIFLIAQEEKGASTSALAERLGISPGAVTKMVKKLASLRLVDHSPYRGVTLTPAGEKIALEVIRHHRLLELYLHEALGYAWDQVHSEAERLEHVLSEEMEERIDALLGRLGLYPGAAVCVRRREPFSGPLFIRVGETEHAIGREVGDSVYVRLTPA